MIEKTDEVTLLQHKNDLCAKRLAFALRACGYSRIELAKKLHITYSTLSHYLTGEHVPRGEKLKQFAEVLNVSYAWLIGINVTMNADDDNLVVRGKDKLLAKFDSLNTFGQNRVLQYVNDMCKISEFKN